VEIKELKSLSTEAPIGETARNLLLLTKKGFATPKTYLITFASSKEIQAATPKEASDIELILRTTVDPEKDYVVCISTDRTDKEKLGVHLPQNTTRGFDNVQSKIEELSFVKQAKATDTQKSPILLSESLIMGLVGTLSGIGFGYLLALGVNNLDLLGGMISSATEGTVMSGIPSTPILTTTNLLSALFFGIAVSILFGIYPAWRASRLEPVDALRYE